ncbi:MAG: type II secretion system minor pseudopilin GspI [Gammaproteobacteria bacterium]
MRPQRGFTLLEVLVALAIVAFGVVAAFNGIIQMAHSTARLQERAKADWIAMNQIAEIRLSGDFPDVSEFDGSVEFAGQPWRWEATVSETGVEDLRRIDMRVALEEIPDDVVTIVTGFISRRAGPPSAGVDWWGTNVGATDGADEGDGSDDQEAGEEQETPADNSDEAGGE